LSVKGRGPKAYPLIGFTVSYTICVSLYVAAILATMFLLLPLNPPLILGGALAPDSFILIISSPCPFRTWVFCYFLYGSAKHQIHLYMYLETLVKFIVYSSFITPFGLSYLSLGNHICANAG
jgi:hypothetical protein